MRAMGGAVKPPERCSSKSHRICEMRPSMKPIAIATPISKTITNTTVAEAPLSSYRLRRRFVHNDVAVRPAKPLMFFTQRKIAVTVSKAPLCL
jgi:hypothetical protein